VINLNMVEEWYAIDEDRELRFPRKIIVCPRCGGRGTHDPAGFEGGITASEWAEDWDEDSQEAYLAGRYDVICTVCNGRNVVEILDEELATEEMRKIVREWEQEEADTNAIYAMERRMGA
jgi:hypothetical protein